MWILKRRASTKVRGLKVIFVCISLIPLLVLTLLLCIAGEGLKVVAFIKNSSSREVKLKYCVYRKHSFFARGKRRVHTKDLLKEVGDPIPPSAEETVTRVITVPHDMEPSVTNCNIIKAEYRLRVSSLKSAEILNNLSISSTQFSSSTVLCKSIDPLSCT